MEELPDAVLKSEEEIKSIMQELTLATVKDELDPKQNALIATIQRLRGKIIDAATFAWLKSPNNPKLLEGLSALLTQTEKSVRDDRKEAERAKDKEEDKATFNQLVEAMAMLADNRIAVPTWGDHSYFLDPNMTFADVNAEAGKIKAGELELGVTQLDMDGNVV